MLRYSVFIVCVGFVCCQINWVNKARVPSPAIYLNKLAQELVYDLEKFEWCNLKIDEFKQTVDEKMYNWRVKGNVTYSNGFVISIQKLEMSDYRQNVALRSVNGESVPHAIVQGVLTMNDVKIGFDVLVELEDPEPPQEPVQKYTTYYTYASIELMIDVTRNLLTKEMRSSPSWTNINSGGIRNRAVFMPVNNVTEVLARRFGVSITDSVDKWCSNIIAPMLVDISTNRVDFPDLCFTDCPH